MSEVKNIQKLLNEIDEVIKYYIILNALNEHSCRNKKFQELINERIRGLKIAKKIIEYKE